MPVDGRIRVLVRFAVSAPMPDDWGMARFGMVHGGSGGVVIGNPWKTHLFLTPDGVSQRWGAAALQAFSWEEVESVTLDFPTTRFRWPGAIVRGLLTPLRVVSPDLWGVEPPPGSAIITSEGDDYVLNINRHHFGGYWLPEVLATQRVLNRLTSSPDTRVRLAQPDDVLRMLVDELN